MEKKSTGKTGSRNRKMKKAYQGSILKRGEVYYWKHKGISGEYTMTALKDAKGNSVTSLDVATRLVIEKSDKKAELDSLNSQLEYLQEVARIKGLIQNLKRISLENLEQVYFEEAPEADSNAVSKHSAIRDFVAWMQKNHPEITDANTVSEEIANEYMTAYWRQGGTGHAFNSRLACLRGVFKFIQGKVNAFKDIQRKHHVCEQRNAFTTEQLAAIWRTLQSTSFRVQHKEEFTAVLIFALHTGARCGDICNMRKSAVAEDLSEISFTPVKTQHSSNRKVSVPCSPAVQELLKKHIDGESAYLFPNMAHWYKTNRSGIAHAVIRLLAASGIEPRESKGNAHRQKSILRYSFHSFRHTFASILANQGTPLITIASLLGHTTISMTQRYSHASSESKQNAVRALAGIV